MKQVLAKLIWLGIAVLGAAGLGVLAHSRGEPISAGWLIVAGVCSYLVAYRFYSRYLAFTVFGLDDQRATPAERLNNGRDFVPTNKWVAAGHHFSAISGAGPLVGPTLAAQFGYLPGTIWLIAGVVLGGAVQDMIVLCASIRRDGKSLGQMAKEEVNAIAGFTAMVAMFAIMTILLAVLSLVVVNALRDSPWGLFTIAATIPIALLMGIWMHHVRLGGAEIRRHVQVREIVLLRRVVPHRVFRRVEQRGPADDYIDFRSAGVAAGCRAAERFNFLVRKHVVVEKSDVDRLVDAAPRHELDRDLLLRDLAQVGDP